MAAASTIDRAPPEPGLHARRARAGAARPTSSCSKAPTSPAALTRGSAAPRRPPRRRQRHRPGGIRARDARRQTPPTSLRRRIARRQRHRHAARGDRPRRPRPRPHPAHGAGRLRSGPGGADRTGAAARNRPFVSFPGQLPVREAFKLGRVLVVPSRAESMPYIVLEAAGARVPMIATNVGGIPEIYGPYRDRLGRRTIPPISRRASRWRSPCPRPSVRPQAAELAAHVAERFSIQTMVEFRDGGLRRGARPAPPPARRPGDGRLAQLTAALQSRRAHGRIFRPSAPSDRRRRRRGKPEAHDDELERLQTGSPPNRSRRPYSRVVIAGVVRAIETALIIADRRRDLLPLYRAQRRRRSPAISP